MIRIAAVHTAHHICQQHIALTFLTYAYGKPCFTYTKNSVLFLWCDILLIYRLAPYQHWLQTFDKHVGNVQMCSLPINECAPFQYSAYSISTIRNCLRTHRSFQQFIKQQTHQ